MRFCLVAVLATLFYSSAQAALTSVAELRGGYLSPSVETVPATIGLGFGWMLCDTTAALPPLESATDCQGLVPSLENTTLTLTPQPTAKPTWHLWSAHQTGQTSYRGKVGQFEVLLSYAKMDGKSYVFVEGRITVPGSKPVYFEAVAPSWDTLQQATIYGPQVDLTGGTDTWTPYLRFAKKIN